jgi:hypothetical protein
MQRALRVALRERSELRQRCIVKAFALRHNAAYMAIARLLAAHQQRTLARAWRALPAYLNRWQRAREHLTARASMHLRAVAHNNIR